jgi:Raf kinase inhibitor-like YbhB/YbcL family protein
MVLFILSMHAGCVENQQPRLGDMKITSAAFENNGSIPADYTCDGADVSPPLSFQNVPGNANSLAVIMDDPDAPMGTWVHWLVWNIPRNTTGLTQAQSIPYPQGRNDFGDVKYGGPCPPSGTHRYFFKLYALDTMLQLPKGSTKQQLEAAMSGHILEEAQLIGTYTG